jgi:hypothetical protein
MDDKKDFTPDPEEADRIAHHLGPDGPVAVVYAWLDLVKAGDFAGAWVLMDDNLRLCRAQAWLWNNRFFPDIGASDLEKEARRMTAVPSTSRLWSDFAAIELQQLLDTWPHRFKALEEGRLGAGSATRVLGPNLEIVLLLEGSGEAMVFDEPTLVSDAFLFVVRMTDGGWRIAAYGDFVPEPGWPPQLEHPAG